MPEYGAIITKDGFYYPEQKRLDRWHNANLGEWLRVTFTLLSKKTKDPKTRWQLGWYWGLLLTEITKELNQQGYTLTIETMPGIKNEIPYITEMVHEGLTAACGLVGENGKGMRLSEMNKYQSSQFLSHVLDVAANLGMDMEKLKAVRAVGAKNGE